MKENKNICLEMDLKDNKSEQEKTQQFTIELLIYNNILDSDNKILGEAEINNEFIDKEKVIFDLPIYYKDKNNQNNYYIKVDDLKKQLIKKEYPIKTSKLYLYICNNDINEYVYINNDKETIDSSMLSPDNKIQLKLKNNIDKKLIKDTFFLLKKHFSELSEKKYNSENATNPDINNNINNIEFNKRTRKIGEIVKKVYAQRMLFNGYYNEEGAKVKCDLENASQKIGIPKKTLDDYLKQIREAREHGFDFNKYKDKPIAFLRNYNKNNKNKEKKDNNNGDDNNKDIDNDNEGLPLEEEI